MDTSKEYIKMCNKAVEIQPLFKCLGDIVSWDNGRVFLVVKCYPDSVNGIRIKEWENDEEIDLASNATVFLPRQDQLQEIIEKDLHEKIYELLSMFNGFVDEYCRTPECNFTSWEQLWLAFVMKEKYNKTWNGEEWKRGEV